MKKVSLKKIIFSSYYFLPCKINRYNHTNNIYKFSWTTIFLTNETRIKEFCIKGLGRFFCTTFFYNPLHMLFIIFNTHIKWNWMMPQIIKVVFIYNYKFTNLKKIKSKYTWQNNICFSRFEWHLFLFSIS